MRKTAIGYTRLSDDGHSIPKQKEAIRDYCERNGLKLNTIYDDGKYASGYSTEERPEYRDFKAEVETGDIHAVVVRDTGRIGRDFDERVRFILTCRQCNVELHSVEAGQHDIDDPWQVLGETAQAAGDDVQKRKEIERAKQATNERIENGCYHGRPPIGLEFADDNCHLQKSEEWETVREIVERRLSGEDVSVVAERVGVSAATVSRVSGRGLEWYRSKFEQYKKGD